MAAEHWSYCTPRNTNTIKEDRATDSLCAQWIKPSPDRLWERVSALSKAQNFQESPPAMEALHLSTVASRHLAVASHSFSGNSGLRSSKCPRKPAKLSSSWTGVRTISSLSSRDLFTVRSAQQGWIRFSKRVWFVVCE